MIASMEVYEKRPIPIAMMSITNPPTMVFVELNNFAFLAPEFSMKLTWHPSKFKLPLFKFHYFSKKLALVLQFHMHVFPMQSAQYLINESRL